MVRATNPFVERLTFFWHRHWANSRDSVSPPQLLITQNDLFRRYADFGANPTRELPEPRLRGDRRPVDAALPDRRVQRQGRAERELRPRADGAVHARRPSTPAASRTTARTTSSSSPRRSPAGRSTTTTRTRVTSYFTPVALVQRPEDRSSASSATSARPTPSTSSSLAPPTRRSSSPSCGTSSSSARRTRRRWTGSSRRYTSSGLQLKPLLSAILTHPALFASLDEPNMIKPPVVYVVGAMRALGRRSPTTTAADYLDAMGQVPYFPPTVAGWEGGLSWLNTNTALARFALRLGAARRARRSPTSPARPRRAAYDRAYAAVGRAVARRRDPDVHRAASPRRAGSARRQLTQAAPARAARADARRPRRTGDVMRRAQPATRRRPNALQAAPTARARTASSPTCDRARTPPIPAEALGGLPGRRPAADAARDGPPHVPAQRRWSASRRSTRRLGSTGTRSGRRPRPRPRRADADELVCIYLNGGNDGLNTIVPVDLGRVRGLRRQARRTSPACSGPPAAARSARPSMPGTGGALAFANPGVSGAGNNGDTKGFDTLYGDGSRRRRLGPRGLPGHRLHAAQPVALREPRLLVRRRAPGAADRLARPLARHLRLDRRTRCRRSRSTPRCPSRSARRRRPCARSRT